MREDLSDVTDEDTGPAPPPPPLKARIPSFRVKDDTDLFGLGLEETGHKASSGEGSWGPGMQSSPWGCPARGHISVPSHPGGPKSSKATLQGPAS